MTYADKGSDPKPIVPALRGFYESFAELYWPLIRVTAGAILFTHGWPKVMAGVHVFAANSLAKRGIEPALFWAYVVVLLETVGAVLIMLGLFTRAVAALLVVEFIVIIFVQMPNGYSWVNRGYEYPLFWGLIFLATLLRGAVPIRWTASSAGKSEPPGMPGQLFGLALAAQSLLLGA